VQRDAFSCDPLRNSREICAELNDLDITMWVELPKDERLMTFPRLIKGSITHKHPLEETHANGKESYLTYSIDSDLFDHKIDAGWKEVRVFGYSISQDVDLVDFLSTLPMNASRAGITRFIPSEFRWSAPYTKLTKQFYKCIINDNTLELICPMWIHHIYHLKEETSPK
jgi:hypothetical protein